MPATDREKAIDVSSSPAPCSLRYRLRARPTLEADQPPVEAIREAFDTTRHWGVEQNLELGRSGDTTREVKVRFPKGSINPAHRHAPLGGAGFYSRMGLSEGTDAACLVYRVRFSEGFDFARGGKLPGLHGGRAPSGGEDVSGEDGFSVRFMWRADGQGELYEYIVNASTDFGLSIGRGTWRFPTGRWLELQLEVVLNTPGRADGVARAWVDRHPVVDQTDVAYRTVDDIHISGLMFSTFFGGSDRSWASPKDQHIQFADFRTLISDQRPRHRISRHD
ncbi:MAG: hypothetical protein R3349_02970 [Geminicoccaceae bacterium]|nr:hypothetical protein [Geminicoccaceae bacterium]